MEKQRGFEIRRLVLVVLLCGAVIVPLFTVAGCGKELARMEENQIRLQAMVAANARELATISSQIHTGTGKLTDGLQALDKDTQQVAAGVAGVRDEQHQFRTAVAAGHEGLHQEIAEVQNNQASLQAGVAQVSDVTQRTAADLGTLAQDHAALHQVVQANQRQISGTLGAVLDNQQQLQTGLGDLRQADAGLAQDVAALAARNDALYTALQDSSRQLTERLVALASGHGQLATDITTVHTLLQTTAGEMATAQASLNEQIGASHQTLTARLADLSAGQQQLQAGVRTLDQKADVTTAAMGEAQTWLQEALQANREALTGQIATSVQMQQTLQGDVRSLGDKADTIKVDIGQVSAAQAALHEAVQTNQETVLAAMAGLSDGQQTLRGGLGALDGKADRLAGGLAAVSAQQQSLAEAVQANRETVTARLAGVAETQATLQGGIRDLDGKADALAGAQDHFRQTLQSHHEQLDAAVAELADGQQTARAQMDTLTATAGQTALDVLTLSDGQATLRQTVQAYNDDTSAQATALAQTQAQMKTGLDALTTTAGQTARDVVALKEGQQGLTQAVHAAATDLGARTDEVAAGLTAVAARQNSLSDTLSQQGQSLSGQVAKVANNQKQFQGGLDTLTATTGRTARDVAALRDDQAALTQTVNAAATDLGTRTDKVAGELTALAAGQNSLNDTLNHQGQALSGQVAEVAEGQQQLQSGLDTLTATAGQTSLDVLALSDRQAGLLQTVKAAATDLGTRTDKVAGELTAVAAGQNSLNDTLNRQGQALSGQVAKVAEGQQQLQNGLDTLTATTGQTALDIMGMSARQEAMQSSLLSQGEAIGTQMAQLADNQEQIQSGLNTMTATMNETSLDVLAVRDNQAGLTQTVKAAAADLGTRTAKVAEDQRQLQGGLDTLTATTGQTALDVMGMSARQEAMQSSLQGQGEAIGTQMARLADGQQQLHSGLEVVTATAGQTSLDTLALSDRQTRLGQAVQAGRQEVAEKLAALVQNQQSWSERLDAAREKVAGMAGSLAALEQQIAGLHTIVQTGLQDTTGVLGTAGRQRQEFETRVGQDVQAVIDALAQLRQMQTSLQEQIAQVQRSTQGQADNLRSVIEQMKATPSATDRTPERAPAAEEQAGVPAPKPPAAEVRVSHVTQESRTPQATE